MPSIASYVATYSIAKHAQQALTNMARERGRERGGRERERERERRERGEERGGRERERGILSAYQQWQQQQHVRINSILMRGAAQNDGNITRLTLSLCTLPPVEKMREMTWCGIIRQGGDLCE